MKWKDRYQSLMILEGDLSEKKPIGVEQFLDRMSHGNFFARLMTKQDINDLISGRLKLNDKNAFEIFLVSIQRREGGLWIELMIDRAPDGVISGNHRLEFDTSDCENLPESFFVNEEIPVEE